MKSAPLILVTPNAQPAGAEFGDPSVSLSQRYTQSLLAAGGLPWIAPASRDPALAVEMLRRAGGLLLTGGNDVHPRFYAPRMPAALRALVMQTDPDRDRFESALVREALRRNLPVLAICRGLQILNAVLGGTLFADIKTQVPGALDHRRFDRKDALVHPLEVLPGSLLEQIAGPKLSANSSHHQAAERVAPGLRVTATAPDGVIEALEWAPQPGAAKGFMLAVQFHPERLSARHSRHRALFEAFVSACGKTAQPQ